MNISLQKQIANKDHALLEQAAMSLGIKGSWETVPDVTPRRQAFYVENSSAGTMAWAAEWNPLRDDHTRYSLIRGLGLLTRNRQVLDKHIAILQAEGLSEQAAVDRAIVCAAAEIGLLNQGT